MKKRYAVTMCPPACRLLVVVASRDADTREVNFDYCPVVAVRSTTDEGEGTESIEPIFEYACGLMTLRTWRSDFGRYATCRVIAAEWPPAEDAARLTWLTESLAHDLLVLEGAGERPADRSPEGRP